MYCLWCIIYRTYDIKCFCQLIVRLFSKTAETRCGKNNTFA